MDCMQRKPAGYSIEWHTRSNVADLVNVEHFELLRSFARILLYSAAQRGAGEQAAIVLSEVVRS